MSKNSEGGLTYSSTPNVAFCAWYYYKVPTYKMWQRLCIGLGKDAELTAEPVISSAIRNSFHLASQKRRQGWIRPHCDAT